MSSAASRETLLDALIQTFTQHPRNLVLGLLILGGLCFSILSVVIGLIVFVLMRWWRSPVWVVGLIGLLLAATAWFIDGVTPHLIFDENRQLLAALFHHQSFLSWSFLSLASFPYGLLLGCFITWLLQWNQGLQNEVKRIAQGRKLSGKILNPKKLQRCLNKITTAACDQGTTLGIDLITGKSVSLSDHDANLHTLAIGTTGSGKTTGLCNLIESAIMRRHPLIYVDGKGDLPLAKRIETFVQSQGVPFYLFSIMGDSLKYNPLSFGGYTSKKDRVIELRHWSEDHYRKLAEGYLQTVFKVLVQVNIPVDLHSLAQHLQPETLYLLARQLNDKTLLKAIESLESQYKDITSLVAEIENIANSEIGHLFDCSEGKVLTLDQALQEKAVVYFCLQPLAFPAYAETLGKLIINDIKSLAASRLSQMESIKLFTIFDEFSVFAGDQIIHLINQGRSAGVHAVLSTQSLSDILRKGGEALLGQILNNTNNYLIQRQNNPADAEILANVIGTESAFQITSQVSTNQGNLGIGSIRPMREFIIHPDDIKRLSRGQAVYLNKQTFRVQKMMVRKSSI